MRRNKSCALLIRENAVGVKCGWNWFQIQDNEGRARHSVRAALGLTRSGAHGVTRPTGYFPSATAFIAAKPFSKSPPIILSQFMIRPNILPTNLFLPDMVHVMNV